MLNVTKLCVFDFDGTLVNTIYDIAASMNDSLAKMGKATHDTQRYYQMVGNGMDALCTNALPGGTDDEVKRLKSIYKEKYLKDCCVLSRPYEGVLELLAGLKEKGIRFGVISNKPQEQMDRIIKKFLDYDDFFMIIGQDGRFPVKPATDSIDYLMQEAQVSKNEVWYIGDSDVDMLFGTAAGVRTIGAAWGFRGEKELTDAGATKIAQEPLEILSLIESL